MFTLICKFLTFVYLLLALACLTWATSIYFQRPSWFDPIPDAVDKGNTPETFAGLKQDIESLGRSASAASGAWGAQLKVLEDLEARRIVRKKEYDVRLGWAKIGNPKDDKNAFYKPVYEKDAAGKFTSFLDVTKVGDAIKGPNDLPLKGADTLLADFSKDVTATVEFEKQVEEKVKEYDALGTQIIAEEARLLKMFEIRAQVQAEAFYLSSFEVNVYETRETVFRRKKQLVQRLIELGGLGK